jgi:hypothetical protein
VRLAEFGGGELGLKGKFFGRGLLC